MSTEKLTHTQPGIQPPQRARLLHQIQDHEEQRRADREADAQALEQIGDIQPRRGAVEAEARLDTKSTPQ